MILWTVQPKLILSKLKSQRTLYTDGRKLTYGEEFRHAYKWVTAQMAERGIGDGRHYPFWAWYRHHQRKFGRKPTLWWCKRESQLHIPYCRIELDVPDKLVLLTDWDKWHEVLNDFPVGSYRYAKSIWAKQDAGIDIRAEKEASWQKIIIKKPRLATKSYGIQACLPHLNISWVKKVDFYIARKHPKI